MESDLVPTRRLNIWHVQRKILFSYNTVIPAFIWQVSPPSTKYHGHTSKQLYLLYCLSVFNYPFLSYVKKQYDLCRTLSNVFKTISKALTAFSKTVNRGILLVWPSNKWSLYYEINQIYGRYNNTEFIISFDKVLMGVCIT